MVREYHYSGHHKRWEIVSREKELDLFRNIIEARRAVVRYLAEQQPLLPLRYCQFLHSRLREGGGADPQLELITERLMDNYQTDDFPRSAYALFFYASRQKWNTLGWDGLREVVAYWSKDTERKIESSVSPKEKKELRQQADEIDRLMNGWEESLRAYGKAYIGYAEMLSRRWRSLDSGELLSAGYDGLLKAVDKFNRRNGIRFTSYASRWIRHEMDREFEKAKDRLNPLSLEDHLRADDDRTIEEVTADENSVDGNVIAEKDFRAQIRSMLARSNQRFKETGENRFVNDKEFAMIYDRFGLPDETGEYPDPMDFPEIGAKHSVSKQDAEQTISRGLEKLRARGKALYDAL